jgi:exopolysaccharide biosynthesis polyprenyl glycosylphosphotransferase
MLVAHQTAAGSFADVLAMRVKVRNFILFAAFLLVWYSLFRLFGLYDSRRLSARSREVFDILKATALGTGFVYIAALVFKLVILTPLFLTEFWFICSTTMVVSRLATRYVLYQARIRGRNLREILIVGTNRRAVLFAQIIESKPTLGYRVLGFADQDWEGLDEFRQGGYPLASDFKEFPFLLRERAIDEVVIALPMKSMYSQASRIVALCEEQGITVRLLSDLFDLRLSQSKTGALDDIPMITLCAHAAEGWQHLAKRVLDFTASLLAIIVLSALFLLTALLVKLTSPGPVFFIQERVGLNKRRFRLYKFRTMVANAESRIGEIEHLNEAQGPVFKIQNDPRLTPLGKFLRKSSLDELPQLFNVLKGDMSLVGPRPLPLRDYQGFAQDWHRRRFSVRPGITCLWQVNGRSSIHFDKWMELDMEYIDHWSFALDMKILAKTIPAVLKGVGAV